MDIGPELSEASLSETEAPRKPSGPTLPDRDVLKQYTDDWQRKQRAELKAHANLVCTAMMMK